MSDTTFRSTQTSEASPEPVSAPAKQTTVSTTNIEVPYMDYHHSHGEPFSVSYFQLGDTWDSGIGGFSKEVNAIESYFMSKIASGELPNDVEAIKSRLKEIEKVANVAKEHRTVVKIGAVASYLRFLNDVDDIKGNIKRYGSK